MSQECCSQHYRESHNHLEPTISRLANHKCPHCGKDAKNLSYAPNWTTCSCLPYKGKRRYYWICKFKLYGQQCSSFCCLDYDEVISSGGWNINRCSIHEHEFNESKFGTSSTIDMNYYKNLTNNINSLSRDEVYNTFKILLNVCENENIHTHTQTQNYNNWNSNIKNEIILTEDEKAFVDSNLESWAIELYKENSYLYKIPDERIKQKRKELIEMLR